MVNGPLVNFLFALTNCPQHTYIHAVESGWRPWVQVERAAGAHGCLLKTQPLPPQEDLGTRHSHSLAQLPAPAPDAHGLRNRSNRVTDSERRLSLHQYFIFTKKTHENQFLKL